MAQISCFCNAFASLDSPLDFAGTKLLSKTFAALCQGFRHSSRLLPLGQGVGLCHFQDSIKGTHGLVSSSLPNETFVTLKPPPTPTLFINDQKTAEERNRPLSNEI